jgi:hypothetical protein
MLNQQCKELHCSRHPNPHPIIALHPHIRHQVLLLAGGAAGGRALRSLVRSARAEQRVLSSNASGVRRGKQTRQVAVDSLFFSRLITILKM